MLENKKQIKSSTLFAFLRDRLFSVINQLHSEGKITMPVDKFDESTVFLDQADYDGSLRVNTYASEDEAQKKNFGIFRFIGGSIQGNKLVDAYTNTYSLETLSFEEYRQDVKTILISYAAQMNAMSFNIQDENGLFTAFFQIQDYPDLSTIADINGVEKFISFTTIKVLLLTDLLHSSNIIFKLDGVQIPYTEITFTRQMIEPAADLKKSYENKFEPSRTQFSCSITGYYKNDIASIKLMNWLFDETRLEDTVRMYYSDGNIVKTGVYLVSQSNVAMPYESVVSYSVALIPKRNPVQTHYGVLVKNGEGSDEYLIGSNVKVTFDVPEDQADNVVIIPNGIQLNQLVLNEAGTYVEDGIKYFEYDFTMPANNVVININIAVAE